MNLQQSSLLKTPWSHQGYSAITGVAGYSCNDSSELIKMI